MGGPGLWCGGCRSRLVCVVLLVRCWCWCCCVVVLVLRCVVVVTVVLELVLVLVVVCCWCCCGRIPGGSSVVCLWCCLVIGGRPRKKVVDNVCIFRRDTLVRSLQSIVVVVVWLV